MFDKKCCPNRAAHHALAGAMLLTCLLAGCHHSAKAPPTPAAAAAPAASATLHKYIVRGIVDRMPTATHPHIHIKNEPIHNIRDFTGKVTGMGSMDMPYALAPGVTLNHIHKGTKVQFTFAVDWSKNYTAITAIKALPKNIRLVFGPAQATTPKK